jgi:hypothetical protein
VNPATASAIFSAVAATASRATILQNRRERRAAAKPDLNVRVMMQADTNPLLGSNAVTVLVVVDNVGAVAATGVNFMLTLRGKVDYGVVGNGFLFPGQSDGPISTGLFVVAPVEPDETRIIVTCRDRLGVLHVYTHKLESREYRPGVFKGLQTPSKQVMMADMYPGHVLKGHEDVNTGAPIAGDGLS